MNNIPSELAKINEEIEDILKSIPKRQIPTCVPLAFKKGKKQGIILGANRMKEKTLELISKWALNLRPHENIYDADAKITWQDLEILRKGIDNLLADLKELNKELDE